MDYGRFFGFPKARSGTYRNERRNRKITGYIGWLIAAAQSHL